ncbi:MAG: hypothetical protein HND53_04955 [Proteobacteria bacterium]|nr:hypothetical protein [Pseudomonadota bacterium]
MLLYRNTESAKTAPTRTSLGIFHIPALAKNLTLAAKNYRVFQTATTPPPMTKQGR